MTGYFGTAMRRRDPLLLLPLLLVTCTTPDPCTRFFEPYPDLVTGRMRTEANADLLEAMRLYATGDFSSAATGLKAHIEHHPQQADVGHLYLASCYLAMGQPYDAELHLDFLE